MNKKTLEKMTREQVIALAVEQENKIADIRGYHSGMDAEKFSILDTDTIIECFMKNEKNFDLNTKLEEVKEMKSMNFEIGGAIYESNDKGNRFYKTVDGKKTRIGQAEFEKAMNTPTEVKTIPSENGDHVVEFAKMGCGYGVRLVGTGDYKMMDKSEIVSKVDARDGDKKFHASFEFMGRRYWTRDAIVEGESKSTKTKRRSKDVAFATIIVVDGAENHITLTAKQVDFINRLPNSNYWENGLDSTLWCDLLADEIGGQFAGKPMTVGAMISTLREKGLVNVAKDMDRKGKPKYIVLTDAGKKVAEEMGLA